MDGSSGFRRLTRGATVIGDQEYPPSPSSTVSTLSTNGSTANGTPIAPVPPEAAQHRSSWFVKFFSWNSTKSSPSPIATPFSQAAKPWFSWSLRFWKKNSSTTTKSWLPFFSWNSRSPSSPVSQEQQGSISPPNTSPQEEQTIIQGSLSARDEDSPSVSTEETSEPTIIPVNPEEPQQLLKAVDPLQDLTPKEQEQLSSQQFLSKLGATEIDAANVKSLPECIVYQIIDIPTEVAAAIIWDVEAVGKTAPNRVSTSDIKRTGNTVEASFVTSVSSLMSHDVSVVTTSVERTSGDSYLFSWKLASDQQPNSYSKTMRGSCLLFPYQGKTLLCYRSISTLKNNAFYSAAAARIQKSIEDVVAGMVKALQQGKQNPQKLEHQMAILKGSVSSIVS